MIKSFKHSGLEKFYNTDSKAGIIPAHAKKLRDPLSALDSAQLPGDLDRAGWRLHPLTGTLAGRWSISVNGNWRLTFSLYWGRRGIVDYLDDH